MLMLGSVRITSYSTDTTNHKNLMTLHTIEFYGTDMGIMTVALACHDHLRALTPLTPLPVKHA